MSGPRDFYENLMLGFVAIPVVILGTVLVVGMCAGYLIGRL